MMPLLKILEDDYALKIDHIRLISYTHHQVYQAVDKDGGQWVLRLMQTYDPVHLDAEMQLLNFLAQETELLAPVPKAHLEALFWQEVRVEDKVYALCVFHYLEGETLKMDTLDARMMGSIATLLANLHQVTEGLVADLRMPDFDFSAILGLDSIYGSAASAFYLTRERQDLLAEMSQKVSDLQVRYQQERSIIHGDALLKNILQQGDRLALIDFEYSAKAWPLYDLSPLLWQLASLGSVSAGLRESYVEAYTRVRSISVPAYEVDLMIALRHAASCLWLMANDQNPHYLKRVPRLLAQRFSELESFLETDRFERRPDMP